MAFTLMSNMALLIDLFIYIFFEKRVPVKEREVKVNIFDMAGHPIFYEVGISYMGEWVGWWWVGMEFR